MIDSKQLAAGRILAGLSRTGLAAMCMMSVGTLTAVETGMAGSKTETAAEAVRKTLEFHGIRFTETGAERV